MTVDDLRVDPATEADVPLILSLIRALADYERLSASVLADEARVRASFFGPARSAEALIARVGGEAVGFAVWFHNYSTFLGRHGLYLEDLFVVPAWRGRGIGRALILHLARVAVERGCGRMEWAVLDWNEPAIRFYKNLGAKPMDEWTVYRLTGDALARLAKESLKSEV
jgi:GNAT superfamily N-acetyltransferase